MAKVKPNYQDVDGFRIPGKFDAEAYRSALSYKPRSDDFFIVTFPKCGTTWVQQICSLIYRKGQVFEDSLQFFTDTPFLELTGAGAAETMKRPGAIKLHLPFHLTPYSPDAKYLYVARNPKDCCVSFFHHTRHIPLYEFSEGTFDDYFEIFINGENDFGDYFDHLLSWYEHKDDSNVFFITYEDIKVDTRAAVLKIAEFMGREYLEAITPEILDKIIMFSSFDFMKKETNEAFQKLFKVANEESIPEDIPEGLKMMMENIRSNKSTSGPPVNHVRKGIIGDWKNHFSPEQNRRLEEKFQQRLKGSSAADLWKDFQ